MIYKLKKSTFTLSKYLSTKNLLVTERKSDSTVTKSGRHHLNGGIDNYTSGKGTDSAIRQSAVERT